jgi:hypothetical protein
MNSNEKVMLENFLEQLKNTKANPKDFDADKLIADSTRNNPDATYLLVQRALGLELALQATQKQLTELQAVNAQTKPTSFVNDHNSWGRAPGSPSTNAPLQTTKTNAVSPNQPSPWGAGLLGTIATTAAGVVVGSMLYQGIQSMLGHDQNQPNLGPLGSNEINNDLRTVQYDQHNFQDQIDSDFGGDDFV